MKVKVKTWRGTSEMDLSQALQPCLSDSGGSLENAKESASKALEISCNLAALMVEKGLISIDEAKLACGVYNQIYE